MKITVCVPAYNEAQIIEQTLRTINNFCSTQTQHQWKIVLADNGSTDETIKLAKRIANISILEVKTRGKGAAIVEAVKKCDTDIFCFIDADLSASPESLPLLITSIIEGNDIAIGSRLLDTTKLNRSFLRTSSSRLFNFYRRIVLGIKVTDTQCGLKALNKKGQAVLALCIETGWFFDIELLTIAEQAGLKIHEISIPWEENYYPERESKLNIMSDGFKGLLAMIRIRYRVSFKKLLETNTTLLALLLVGIFTYGGLSIWHADAVKETGRGIESMYFERGDSTGYVEMAESILNGDEILLPNDESARGLRTPGYPIFLAGVFTLSNNPFLIIIIQVIIALATIPFIYKIGLKLTNSKISFFATLLYIIYPTTSFLNTQVLSEVLFVFFTSISLWLLLTTTKYQSFHYISIGITAGIATLIRPSFLYIIPFIIAYIFSSKNKAFSQKIISGGITLLAFFIVLAPWIHANQRDFGNPALSTAGNYNILYVYIPQFLAQNSGATEGWISINQEFTKRTESAGYKIGSHRASDYEKQQIKSELEGKTLSYIVFHIERSILTLVTSGLKMLNNEMTELDRPLFSSTPWLIQHIYTHGISLDLIKNNFLALVDALLMALVTILMPISVIVGIWKRDKEIWGLLLIFSMIIITVLLAGPNGNARYRMPIQPYIFLLAISSAIIILHFLKHNLQKIKKFAL